MYMYNAKNTVFQNKNTYISTKAYRETITFSDGSSSLLFSCPSSQMIPRWRCAGIIHQLPGQFGVSVSCILWHFLFCFSSFDGFVHNRGWTQPPGFVKRCVEYAGFLKLLLQDLNSVSKPTQNFTWKKKYLLNFVTMLMKWSYNAVSEVNVRGCSYMHGTWYIQVMFKIGLLDLKLHN